MATKTPATYDDMTREELYDLAQARDVEGRSQLSKDELAEALRLDDKGPDAVELLLEQHNEIRRLFAEYSELSTQPSKRKDELAQLLVLHLVKHAEVEELVFYPAARSEIKGLDAEIDEDLEEHHAAELLLWEIDKLTSSDERFDAKIAVLHELVSHHLEEEEQDLFPKVREGLPEERRRQLGAAMMRAHKIAPSRPHPISPDQPPANLIVGLVGTGQDAIVGVFRFVKRTVLRR